MPPLAVTDVGLNPPVRGNIHSRTGQAGTTGMKFGMVVVSAQTANHAEMVLTTTAGDPLTLGVITTQGDPNNSGAFALGDEFSVRDAGDVQVLVDATTALNVGDILIASTTAGQAKKLASETGTTLCILGRSMQKITVGAAAGLVSCRLELSQIKL